MGEEEKGWNAGSGQHSPFPGEKRWSLGLQRPALEFTASAFSQQRLTDSSKSTEWGTTGPPKNGTMTLLRLFKLFNTGLTV